MLLTKRHTTRDGRSLHIFEMTDEHLNNYVDLVISKISAKLRLTLSAKATEASAASLYKAKLYGIEIPDVEELADRMEEYLSDLMPYFAEQILRGTFDQEKVQELLQKVYAREGQESFEVDGDLLSLEDWHA